MKRQSRSRLRTIRVDHEPRLSQSRVAKKAGMGLFRYWQIENGDGPEPSAAERAAVAAALNVDVSAVAWPEQSGEQGAVA